MNKIYPTIQAPRHETINRETGGIPENNFQYSGLLKICKFVRIQKTLFFNHNKSYILRKVKCDAIIVP
jgi:hypothetical protein